MAKERRDSKNRILWKGEYQKEDGRYMYRYTDLNGKARFVYSWTLTKADRTPKGKPCGKCLRDLEKEIAVDIIDQIDTTVAKKSSVDDYFELYINQKKGLEESTRRNYRLNYKTYISPVIGGRRIADVKYSDIKRLYITLICEKGLSVGSVGNINIFLNPLFKMAKRDNCIRSNPVEGVMSEIKREFDTDAPKRHPLTIAEQEEFIDYVRLHKKYNHWLPIFTFLLGTGCRVGEMAGLTWDDLDFETGMISINKTLMYYPDEHSGKAKFSISPPKTNAGRREIPMFLEVRKMLHEEKLYQMRFGFCKSNIDGYTGFVFLNRAGEAFAPKNINAAIKRIVESHNKNEAKLAEEEGREPLMLPHFTAHNLRHTFCTRMCENGMNLKVLQTIMGHANIAITMDIYNEATKDFTKEVFYQTGCKVRIC